MPRASQSWPVASAVVAAESGLLLEPVLAVEGAGGRVVRPHRQADLVSVMVRRPGDRGVQEGGPDAAAATAGLDRHAQFGETESHADAEHADQLAIAFRHQRDGVLGVDLGRETPTAFLPVDGCLAGDPPGCASWPSAG